MIEVEIKIAINNTEEIKRKLEDKGFKLLDTIKEEDVYYDNEAGYIKNNDSAVRIRSISNPDDGSVIACQLNYKGPRLDDVSMTRPEYEVLVSDKNAAENILNGLGYKSVIPRVTKLRCEYNKEDINACVDTVEGLGDYLELEIVTELEGNREEAFARIEKLLNELGYNIEETTNVSYLSQLINTIK